MKSKIFVLCFLGVLLLFCLSDQGMTQQLTLTDAFQEDSVDIAISYATAYPGTETWIEVQMKNPVPVAGYNFYIAFGNPDLARFCQDDTGACMVSDGGPTVWCECFDSPCVYVHTWNTEAGIPPSPNYQTLFQICVETCCIPDSTLDRCAAIYLSGDLSDPEGHLLPYRFNPGELCVWWSVPGDANADSLVTIADAVLLINYLYRDGPEPCVCEAADANGDCLVDLGDLVYLLQYLFRGGRVPIGGCPYTACPHEDCWPE
ncbi:MAG: dockerin type I repeat-containing protein [Deltaproteobacteria bacterium]|nr:MAG: dockerin type I repeat-containing protein [Deltaproteobacteria bacterium]